MKTIAFMSQKGGSGKTTLSVHVACAAGEAGERVVVVDTDPQGSATAWGSARAHSEPPVATVSASDLDAVLQAAKAEGMTLAVVDTAPHATAVAAQIARAVDLVLIPVRPSAFDLAAVGQAVSIVEAAGARAAFVLSACPFRAPEVAETRAVLAGYGLPIVDAEITDRRPFARAVSSGRAVTEFESTGKAADEIRALWDWIKGELQ